MNNQHNGSKVKVCENIEYIDWRELSELYRIAPLGNKSVNWLKSVYENSRFYCFVYQGEQLIGAGRALADGFDCSYICDLAVHPAHQGKGIGKQIVKKLINRSKGHKKIILYSVVGMEPFYRSCGFQSMTTAMAIFADQDKASESGLIEVS